MIYHHMETPEDFLVRSRAWYHSDEDKQDPNKKKELSTEAKKTTYHQSERSQRIAYSSPLEDTSQVSDNLLTAKIVSNLFSSVLFQQTWELAHLHAKLSESCALTLPPRDSRLM